MFKKIKPKNRPVKIMLSGFMFLAFWSVVSLLDPTSNLRINRIETVQGNVKKCECSNNNAFGSGNSCAGGYCDGCSCVYSNANVSGVCGSANGQVLSGAPSTVNLCSVGNASAVAGSGPWSWTCAGLNAGATVNCLAQKIARTDDDCECFSDSECGIKVFGVAGGTCENCRCVLNGKCDNSDWLARCAIGGYREFSLSGTRPWTWDCVGTNNGRVATGCTSGKNNPTQYASLNGDYGQATSDAGSSMGRATVYGGNIRGYLPYFRIFIPPGTVSVEGLIYEWVGNEMIARHEIPPIMSFDPQPERPTLLNLETYEVKDQYNQDPVFPGNSSNNGRVQILADNMYNSPLSVSRAGWFYVKTNGYIPSNPPVFDMAFHITVDSESYNEWYLHSGSNPNGSINWERDVESVITYGGTSTSDPTCYTKTCFGNSCYDGTNWIAGTKTENCAIGSVSANPTSIVAPATTSFITWTSNKAKSMEAQCIGPVSITRGGWFLNNSDCKTSSLVPECTDKGYELKFTNGQSGTEVCTFYPTNISDNLPGTPFSVNIQVKGTATCGNNIIEDQEECDYNPTQGQTSYVPCPTGKTCQKCKCTIPPNNNPDICQPDDPSCAKSTCKDVSCFDGCNYQKGLKDCIGRR